MENNYKAFPPGWNNIRVPTHAKRATLAGIATYTPCVPKGIWGQRVAWGLVALGGARLLPGRTATWEPPFEEDEWRELLDQLRTVVGDFDSHTVYERRRLRTGLMMLLLKGDQPVGFVKARELPGADMIREERALDMVEKARPRTFDTPRALGSGEVAGWRYLVTTAMPPRMHRMIEGRPGPELLDEVTAALGGLERPDDVPDHWQPFHGDFTPWNLRQFGDGRPWLIDWEDCGYAPPGADDTMYLATAFAIGKTLAPIPLPASEAVEYWWEEMNRRIREKLDWGLELRQLDHGLLEALAAGETK
ncbi:MAG: phosphotransferase [Acidimicrobiia bacterium]|nr:phosphotransferase [Acidimicrobiia bacterium]